MEAVERQGRNSTMLREALMEQWIQLTEQLDSFSDILELSRATPMQIDDWKKRLVEFDDHFKFLRGATFDLITNNEMKTL